MKTGPAVSRNTIRRRLSLEYGLKSCKPARKLRLTQAMKKKRQTLYCLELRFEPVLPCWDTVFAHFDFTDFDYNAILQTIYRAGNKKKPVSYKEYIITQ